MCLSVRELRKGVYDIILVFIFCSISRKHLSPYNFSRIHGTCEVSSSSKHPFVTEFLSSNGNKPFPSLQVLLSPFFMRLLEVRKVVVAKTFYLSTALLIHKTHVYLHIFKFLDGVLSKSLLYVTKHKNLHPRTQTRFSYKPCLHYLVLSLLTQLIDDDVSNNRVQKHRISLFVNNRVKDS